MSARVRGSPAGEGLRWQRVCLWEACQGLRLLPLLLTSVGFGELGCSEGCFQVGSMG